jgi:hypothetical protein
LSLRSVGAIGILALLDKDHIVAVRDHPYQTIGIAVGLGLLIGALDQRWWATRG